MPSKQISQSTVRISKTLFLGTDKKIVVLTESVLPEPVCAMPTISLPLKAIDHPCTKNIYNFNLIV